MTYFISDIHGEYELFSRLLEKIKFSSTDTLVVLGDMIDKGPDSIRVLKSVYAMSNAVCILGNHEYDLLKRYRALMESTHENFEGVLDKIQAHFSPEREPIDWNLLDWLDALPFFVQTQAYIGVHAGVPLGSSGRVQPLEEGSPEHFVYDRTFKNPETAVNDNRTILFGHTPTKYLNGTGEIILYPRREGKGFSRIHLDTGAYLTGMLGCFCLETGACFYSIKE